MNDSQERYGRHPFNQPLIDTGLSSSGKISQLQNNPDAYIREKRILRSLQNERTRYLKGKWLFDELQQRYGINIPDRHIIIGADSLSGNNISIYIATDRIYGKNLGDPGVFEGLRKTTHVPKLDRFYTAVTQYYRDKYLSGEEYLSDFFNEQFVYGRRRNDTEDQIYLVDLDPEYNRFGHGFNNPGISFTDQIYGLCEMVFDIEAKLKGGKLVSARSRLLAILESDRFREEIETSSLGLINPIDQPLLTQTKYRLMDRRAVTLAYLKTLASRFFRL